MEIIVAILAYVGQGESGVIVSAYAVTVSALLEARIGARIYTRLVIISRALAHRADTPEPTLNPDEVRRMHERHNVARHF